jgi:hypothetical protein
VIKKIVVHSDATNVRGGEAHYNMEREKWDVRNLLEVTLYQCKVIVFVAKYGVYYLCLCTLSKLVILLCLKGVLLICLNYVFDFTLI